MEFNIPLLMENARGYLMAARDPFYCLLERRDGRQATPCHRVSAAFLNHQIHFETYLTTARGDG